MKKTFVKERKELLDRSLSSEIKMFSEKTAAHLPEQLKKYLLVCGYMNTPAPINANVHWAESYLKLSPEKEWGRLQTAQFNLFRIVFANSKETAQSALITVFCEFLFIPGYILSPNVEWESLSENSVRATLTDSGIVVSGVFYFDENGLFSHFETDDRYYETGKNTYKKAKFSTIVDGYKNQGDVKIAERVRIIWLLPEGDYEYYRGVVDRIEFNVKE
jgi:hypothetical protein